MIFEKEILGMLNVECRVIFLRNKNDHRFLDEFVVLKREKKNDHELSIFKYANNYLEP